MVQGWFVAICIKAVVNILELKTLKQLIIKAILNLHLTTLHHVVQAQLNHLNYTSLLNQFIKGETNHGDSGRSPITASMTIRIVLLWPEVHICTHKTQSIGMSPCLCRHVTMSSDCDKTLHITPPNQAMPPLMFSPCSPAGSGLPPSCLVLVILTVTDKIRKRTDISM